MSVADAVPPDSMRKSQFAIVPMWVHRRIIATRTRTAALAVYVELVGQYAGGTQDAEGLRVWPEIQQIADSMGVPKSSVERALKVLIGCGVVLKKRTVRRNQYWLPQEDPEAFVQTMAEFQSVTSDVLDSVQSVTSDGPGTVTSDAPRTVTSDGLYKPDPSIQTQEIHLSPPAVPQPTPEPPVRRDERETNAAPDKKPAAADADVVVAAYSQALHRPVTTATRTALRQQAAQLLADGFPSWWLADRARELAANGWTDLAKHCACSTVPTVRTAPDGREPWCGRCGDSTYRMIKDPARDYELVECGACHPAAVARRRRAQTGEAA